jgi:hypothetical protein
MIEINELTNEQRRHMINAQQAFEAYESRRADVDRQFLGSMRWVERKGVEYLLRKRGSSEKSLGPRSAETERIFQGFQEGRSKAQDDLKALSVNLQQLAPLNVAAGLGRVPKLTGRILRRMAEARLLGRHLHVVGTNALFAYEARCGVQLAGDLLATNDADFLLDARRSLRFLMDDVRAEGVLGLIRKIDTSFEPRMCGDYRAVNRTGFFVDLIRAEERNEAVKTIRDRIAASGDDLRGSPIRSMGWLINAPKFTGIAVDEGGLPVRIHTIDPRAFALHKAWMANQMDRDPVKRQRDRDQAFAAARLATAYLGLSFDAEDLSALPAEIRRGSQHLLAGAWEPGQLANGELDLRPDGW